MANYNWDLEENELHNEYIIMHCKHEYEYVYDGYIYCSKCGKMITHEEYIAFEALNYPDVM